MQSTCNPSVGITLQTEKNRSTAENCPFSSPKFATRWHCPVCNWGGLRKIYDAKLSCWICTVFFYCLLWVLPSRGGQPSFLFSSAVETGARQGHRLQAEPRAGWQSNSSLFYTPPPVFYNCPALSNLSWGRCGKIASVWPKCLCCTAMSDCV